MRWPGGAMKSFLSYSGADSQLAEAVYKYLSDAGEDVFFFPRAEESKVMASISAAIEGSSRFVYLLSKNYVKSGYCEMEWSAYADRCGRDRKLKIIGVQLDDTNPPSILTAWKYLNRAALGSDPFSDTSWMKVLIQEIRSTSPVSPGRPSNEDILGIADQFSRRVVEGPENRDLLQAPLLAEETPHCVQDGLVFLKPEGTYSVACLRRVVSRLLQEGINVVQARKYTGGNIQERGLFDKHYFGPVIIAQKRPPDLDENERKRLQQYYFERWHEYYGSEEEPSERLIIPALTLLRPPYNLKPHQVSELWDRGRAPDLFWNGKPDGLNKIGYQKSVFPVRDARIAGGKARLILNGYVPGYKRLLEAPRDQIRVVCLRVATRRNWDEIRDNVLGGDSNPARCAPTTLRRQAYENPQEFGIPRDCIINGQQNLLHASATPLEGVYEVSLWFDINLVDTYLGAYLANRVGQT
jgi:TIR domain